MRNKHKIFFRGVSVFIGIIFCSSLNAQLDSVRYHDATFESQWGSSAGNDQFRCYVRFTPPYYPAQLRAARAYFRNSVANATFKWVVSTDPAGNAAGGVNPVYISPAAIPNPAAGGITDSVYTAYFDFTSSNLTLASGDFYVGVSESNNNGFLGIAIDNAPATNAFDDRQWQYLFGNWATLASQASSGQFGITAFFSPVVTGVGQVASENSQLDIFPNPAFNFANIILPVTLNGDATLDVINMQGETVSEQKITSAQQQVDISMLAPGIYFVNVKNESQFFSGKFVRQ